MWSWLHHCPAKVAMKGWLAIEPGPSCHWTIEHMLSRPKNGQPQAVLVHGSHAADLLKKQGDYVPCWDATIWHPHSCRWSFQGLGINISRLGNGPFTSIAFCQGFDAILVKLTKVKLLWVSSWESKSIIMMSWCSPGERGMLQSLECKVLSTCEPKPIKCSHVSWWM